MKSVHVQIVMQEETNYLISNLNEKSAASRRHSIQAFHYKNYLACYHVTSI